MEFCYILETFLHCWRKNISKYSRLNLVGSLFNRGYMHFNIFKMCPDMAVKVVFLGVFYRNDLVCYLTSFPRSFTTALCILGLPSKSRSKMVELIHDLPKIINHAE